MNNIYFDTMISDFYTHGALMMRKLIEEDTEKMEGYIIGVNPYDFWELELQKWQTSKGKVRGFSKSLIRSWTYPWSSENGNMPLLDTYFYMKGLVKSRHAVEFENSLMYDPDELKAKQKEMYLDMGEMLHKHGDEYLELAKTIDNNNGNTNQKQE